MSNVSTPNQSNGDQCLSCQNEPLFRQKMEKGRQHGGGKIYKNTRVKFYTCIMNRGKTWVMTYLFSYPTWRTGPAWPAGRM